MMDEWMDCYTSEWKRGRYLRGWRDEINIFKIRFYCFALLGGCGLEGQDLKGRMNGMMEGWKDESSSSFW